MCKKYLYIGLNDHLNIGTSRSFFSVANENKKLLGCKIYMKENIIIFCKLSKVGILYIITSSNIKVETPKDIFWLVFKF